MSALPWDRWTPEPAAAPAAPPAPAPPPTLPPPAAIPVKSRITLPPDNSDSTVVIAQKLGSIGFWDKAKGWYKALIAGIGAVLVAINELTPLTDFLPAEARHWVTVAITILTTLLTALKANETWIDAPTARPLP